jgi:hypothetical protein
MISEGESRQISQICLQEFLSVKISKREKGWVRFLEDNKFVFSYVGPSFQNCWDIFCKVNWTLVINTPTLSMMRYRVFEWSLILVPLGKVGANFFIWDKLKNVSNFYWLNDERFHTINQKWLKFLKLINLRRELIGFLES